MDALTEINSNLLGRADAYGSIALRYQAKSSRNLYGSVMVHDTGHPIMYHLDAMTQAPGYVTGSREGIWWLPTKTTRDYLVLTNQADHPLQGTLWLYDAAGKPWSQPFQLGARQTQRLSVRQLLATAGLNGQYGGIKVEVPNGAGSLDTEHLVYDEIAGFSATLKMFDYDPRAKLEERDYAGKGRWTTRAPMLALSNPDPVLAFPAKTVLQPMLLLRNTTRKTVKADVIFHWRSASKDGRVSIPELTLAPFESHKIDVHDLQMNGTLPFDASWAQVSLTTDSLPDEVMAVAASYDATLRYGAQTPFSDQLIAHLEGGQWQVDATHTSLIAAGNGGDKPVKAALTFLYDQGRKQYRLERTIAADDQWWVDVGQLIRNQVPDVSGSTLPASLTGGAYQLREISEPRQDLLYEGKVITDKTFGHATYGCMVCCGYGGDAGPVQLIDNPVFVLSGGFAYLNAYANNACSGSRDLVTDYFQTWSSSATPIMTAASDGTVTGVAIGTASIRAQASQLPSGQGQDQRLKCPFVPAAGTSDGQVNPQITFTGQTQSLNNTTQSVVVGQQVNLTANFTLPSGITIQSQSWQVPATAIGGYNPTPTSGTTTAADLTHQSTTFYWVDARSPRDVTYHLTLSDGSSTSASVSFNTTAAPSGSLSASGLLLPVIRSNGTRMGPGSDSLPGITFTATSQSSGTTVFIQTVDHYNITHTDIMGSCSPFIGSGLDTGPPYPNVTPNSTNDRPAAVLFSSDSRVTADFSATMYLLWQSSTTNSIPVPLGNLNWKWYGDATQTNNTWSINSSTRTITAGPFVYSSSYPQWSSQIALTDTCQGATYH